MYRAWCKNQPKSNVIHYSTDVNSDRSFAKRKLKKKIVKFMAIVLKLVADIEVDEIKDTGQM